LFWIDQLLDLYAQPDTAFSGGDSELTALSQDASHRHLRVFLCHSSGDKPAVRELYQHLQAEDIEPWLDEKNLLPGQDWEYEIRKAVRATDVVIICLSQGSINRAGYVQKEIKFALDVADEQPEGRIFLIPARLEECNIPDRLRHLHWVNLFEENGYENLIRALRERADQKGLILANNQQTRVRTLPSQSPLTTQIATPGNQTPLDAVEQQNAQRRRKILFSLIAVSLLVLVIIFVILRAIQSTMITGITPQSTSPSTLAVEVSINEDQNASVGSQITLLFSTKDSNHNNYVIFTHEESINCNGIMMALGNKATYSFNMNTLDVYSCYYHWNGQSFAIFSFHTAQKPLSPVLQLPVPGTSIISVSYTSDNTITNSSNCRVQVTANAPDGSVTGDPEPQNGNYTGPDVSSLNGSGNLVMTRTCTFDNTNISSGFASVLGTYHSTSAISHTWSG
jgi:hypothetical protein